MKFKTIVVTKRKIIAGISAIALICAGVAVFKTAAGNKYIEVFGYKSDGYGEILSESLPSDKKVGIKEIIGRIFGIDTENPAEIIGKYNSALDKTGNEDNLAPESGISENTAPTKPPETEKSAVMDLPPKAEIAKGQSLKMNNSTDYEVDMAALCRGDLKIKPDSDNPQVLIMHTHTTECYLGDEMSGETERNTDDNVNVVAVGDEICKVLDSYGIKTVHDLTYHDYPSYQGSYSRALKTIESRLSEYPSIKAVLDIHRDAFVYSDGSRLRVACNQNGVETAQVMLVVGTNSMGLWHDNWQENLRFATKIQSAANLMYPNLMRPINLRTERFNGHTTLGSMILEVGSNGNTLEEAKEGGRDVARAIAAALLNG